METEGDLDVRGFIGLDDAVRPGFGEVRLGVELRGPASDEEYARLKDTVDAHCPVLDLLRRSEIDHRPQEERPDGADHRGQREETAGEPR